MSEFLQGVVNLVIVTTFIGVVISPFLGLVYLVARFLDRRLSR